MTNRFLFVMGVVTGVVTILAIVGLMVDSWRWLAWLVDLLICLACLTYGHDQWAAFKDPTKTK